MAKIKERDKNPESKDKGGRPPIFNSVEELSEKIEDYFANGIHKKKIIVGKAQNQQIVEIEYPTITGLCLHIGFESRQSFYDYEKDERYSYIIKRARLRIEMNYEEQLQTGIPTGAIFALKNMSWVDKSETDIKNSDGSLSNKIDLSKLSKETLRELINAGVIKGTT